MVSIWDLVLHKRAAEVPEQSQQPRATSEAPDSTQSAIGIHIITGEFTPAEISSILAGQHTSFLPSTDLPATSPKFLCDGCLDALTDRIVLLDGKEHVQCVECAQSGARG